MVAITYHTTGAWGAGIDVNLTAAQVDTNFYNLSVAVEDLIANPSAPVTVTSISRSGLTYTFHYSDTTEITQSFPFVGQVRRGEWLPLTFYAALDTVRVTGVGGFWAQFDHTSPAVFDPDETIGSPPEAVWVKEFDEAPLVPAPADLADLGDVSITSPANNDFAQYQTSDSKWHNRTPTQATASLVAVIGDSGSGGTKGLVPAPAAGDAAAGKFLKADGTYAAPSGSGLSTTLTSAHIYVGNGSAVATDVAASGDLTLANTGAFTIAANAVTNAKAAQMAAHRFKGNNTGSTADAIDLTAAELTAELSAVVGDSGSGGTKGLAPAPAAGDAAAGKFLKADGTYAVPAGGGASTLASLSDAAIASPANNDVLVWDGTDWVNRRPHYAIAISAPQVDAYTASQVLGHHPFACAVTIPANLGAHLGRTSHAGGSVSATASTVISVEKAAAATPNSFSQVGTITIAASGVVDTLASSGGTAITFADGDVVRFVAPASPDATFAGFYAVIVGYQT